MSEHTTLYRLYDQSGALLYVGIAGNPGRRFEQHRGDKPWWGEVAEMKVEHYPTRKAAEDAERRAIMTEHPAYNVMHKPRCTRQPTPFEQSVARGAVISRWWAEGWYHDLCPTCRDEHDDWQRYSPHEVASQRDGSVKCTNMCKRLHVWNYWRSLEPA